MTNRFVKRRPSPAMVIALIALFVALGGTAVAAKVMINSSKQLKAGVVHRSDIHKSAVDSTKVANGSLTLDDLSGDAKGTIQAAGTQALEAFRIDGPSGVKMNTSQKVATLSNIPPGAYALFAKTVLSGDSKSQGLLQPGKSIGGHCTLDAGGDGDQSRALLGGPGANSPGVVYMQLTRTYSQTGEATLTCDATNADWAANNTSIIAIRLGASARQIVEQR